MDSYEFIFYMDSTDYMDCLECWLVTVTRRSSSGKRFGDSFERETTCLLADIRRPVD
jgi:hypothetical protein